MIDYSKVDWGNAADTFTSNYAKQTEKSSKGGNKVDLTQYLSLVLPEKENEGEVVLRILPNQDDPHEFYVTKKFHNIKVGKNWAKIYDPAQDGEESPLADKYAILKVGDKTDQESARQYISKDFYIVRCIQRGKEQEGVKFWRFAYNYKKTGIMDKLKPLIARLNEKSRGAGAIWNPIAGRDIILSLVKDTSKGKSQTNVVSIQLDDEITPLSKDKELMTKWLSDTKTWKDVYSKKSIDYLRIVADGGEPVWNPELKKMVAKVGDDVATDNPIPMGLPTPTSTYNDEVEENEYIDMNDLPF